MSDVLGHLEPPVPVRQTVRELTRDPVAPFRRHLDAYPVAGQADRSMTSAAAALGAAARCLDSAAALSQAWSVMVSLLTGLLALATTVVMLNPKPGEERRIALGVPIVCGALSAWWILRAAHASRVRRALRSGELRGDLAGPGARVARTWLLCEAISTIVPGSSVIGPPLLVASVNSHASAARAAAASAAIPPVSADSADAPSPLPSEPPIVGAPREPAPPPATDRFRAESRWEHRRIA